MSITRLNRDRYAKLVRDIMRHCVLPVALLQSACGSTEPPIPATLTVSPMSFSFASLGDTATLSAIVRDQTGATMTGAAVVWTSSAPMVATVSTGGLVTALGNGTATITATSGPASGLSSVTVDQFRCISNRWSSGLRDVL